MKGYRVKGDPYWKGTRWSLFLEQHFVQHRIIWDTYFLDLDPTYFLFQHFFWPNVFWIFAPNILLLEKFFGPLIFLTIIFVGPKFVWTRKFDGPSNFVTHDLFWTSSPSNFFTHNLFWTPPPPKKIKIGEKTNLA